MRVARTLVLMLVALALVVHGGSVPAVAKVDPALTKKIRTVLADPRVRGARVGVVVRDADTGEYLFRRAADTRLIPASNLKMVTAAAALSELGPSYRFHTDVLGATPFCGVVMGDLYLKGYGDPTTRSKDYRALARRLAARGVRKVVGRLVVDATWFDDHRYSRHWDRDYADDYYAAEVSALTIAPDTDYDAGTITVKIKAGREGRKPTITTVPAAAKKFVTIKNKAKTTKTGPNTLRMSRRYGSSVIKLTGRVPKGGGAIRDITVADPKLLAARLFRLELARAGVTVLGHTVTGRTPAGTRVLARDRSLPLSDLVVPFLKLSNNSHGEALAKTLGAEATGHGTWAAGVARLQAYLRTVGVDTATVHIVDGSGLGRANKLTAKALAQVLVHARHQSWFRYYYRAMPVAGRTERMVGGAMRYRMMNTAAEGNAHAKTGWMQGVTSLAGYVRDRRGRFYVFAMISNYRRVSPRPVEDALVLVLARHGGKGR